VLAHAYYRIALEDKIELVLTGMRMSGVLLPFFETIQSDEESLPSCDRSLAHLVGPKLGEFHDTRNDHGIQFSGTMFSEGREVVRTASTMYRGREMPRRTRRAAGASINSRNLTRAPEQSSEIGTTTSPPRMRKNDQSQEKGKEESGAKKNL
jgi:hypothetical protein